MSLILTRKGKYRLTRADGSLVSQHNYLEEAIESAAKASGTYSLTPPSTTIEVTGVATPPVNPPVDPPVDPPANPTGTLAIDYSYVDKASPEYAALIALVESELANGRNYGFQIQDAAVAYKLTGNEPYRQLALTMAEAQVAAAEAAIAAGNKPAVAGDSYLEIGPMISGLAMAYAWCTPTQSQRTRWRTYADRAISNVWDFANAKWGDKAYPGNGWGANDPGNNYYYSFCSATIHWGLATNNTAQLDYMRNDRLVLLSTYFDNLAGGGSREGTGYGLSAKVVFEFMAAWRDSGHAVPASIARHARDSVTFWTHATMPGHDRYAPIGDLARESTPYLMEYHRELIMRGAWLAGDLPTRQLAGLWALTAKQTPDYNRTWARRNALFSATPGGTDPAALTYLAAGTGNLFSRTGWDAQAKAVHVIAGPFDQSHAHEEQGGFTFYAGGFQTVTANIFSRSGINQAVTAHNVLRFDRGGSALRQKRVDGAGCTLQISTVGSGGEFTASTNIKPVYPDASITAYRRGFDFSGGALTVTDDFAIASGTAATFQVCTPGKPVIAGNVATAGKLKITVLEPAGAVLTVNADPNSGDVTTPSYRLDVAGGATRYKVRIEG